MIAAAVLGMFVPFLLYLAWGILLDKAGEAEWRPVQRAWDQNAVSVTGALHREVIDRSQHLM